MGASPTSSSSKPQVFLSFRGDDTRDGFTNFLYDALQPKGYEIFMDDKSLEGGKDFDPELLRAIEASQFAVVVFSKNYASSTWCLRELAKSMDCRKNRGLTVFPVFFHVDPADLRKLRGELGEALNRHKNDKPVEMVESWEKAVMELGGINGEHVTKGRREPDVIGKIVTKVSEKLDPLLSPSVIKENVGIESRIEKFKVYLNRDVEGVGVVGIWGIGGIGKTTLAKEVFERIHHSFEVSGIVYINKKYSEHGNSCDHCLVLLQKHFCEHVLKCQENIQTVDLGGTKIKQRLSSKTVLIVLDDVDKQEQIEALVGKPGEQNDWFGSKSRIIVTTRNRELLKEYGDNYNNIYKVDQLTEDEGLQFFYQKALRNKHPPNDVYKELSLKFVKYACGLPLALIILSRLLSGGTEEQWKKQLEHLAKNPDEKISNELRLSYDALSGTNKQIFLDIACTLNGEDESSVTKTLEGCNLNPAIGLPALVDRSLITIEGGKVLVHDLLKQMAWHIIREEKKAGKRSKSFDLRDAPHVPEEKKLPDDIGRLLLLQRYLSERNPQSLPENLPSSLKISDSPMLTTDSSDCLTMGSTSGQRSRFMDARKSSGVDEDCILQPPLEMTNVLYVHPHNLSGENIKRLIDDGKLFQIRFPSYRSIPEWFSCNGESSLEIELSLEDPDEDPVCKRIRKGFALFLVFEIKEHYKFDKLRELNSISCDFYVDKERLQKSLIFRDFEDLMIGSNGVCSYVPSEWFEERLNTSSQNFHASVSTNGLDIELRMFGVHQVFGQDMDAFSNELAQSVNDHFKEVNFNLHCKKLLDGEGIIHAASSNIIGVEHKQRGRANSLRARRNEPVHTRSTLDNKRSKIKVPRLFSFFSEKRRKHERLVNDTYSMLPRLFEGSFAREHHFSFAFPFPILSPWFFHHSVGNAAVCYLPPDIYNDKRWLGLELYIQCRRCRSDLVDDSTSRVGYLDVRLYGHGIWWFPLFTCRFKINTDGFVAFHVPHKYILTALNNCKGISAFFVPTTTDLEVKMCGTRLLYEQDSKSISEGIMECIRSRSDLLSYVHESVKGLLERNAAVEQEIMLIDQSAGEPMKLNFLQKLLTSTEQVAKEVATSLHNHIKEYAEGRAVNEFDPVLLHGRRNLLQSWDGLSATFNHLHITAETIIYDQIETFEDLLVELSKHRVLVTVSLNGHMVFVSRRFHPSSPYNVCFPSREIPEWFGYQESKSKVAMELPPNLCDDKSWRGLVICASFSVKETPTKFPEAPFKLVCHLASEGQCLNPAALCSISSKDQIQWLLHQPGQFIWLTYVPRVMLRELNGKHSVEAWIYNPCPELIVDKCGIRLLYEKDVEEVRQLIYQTCTSVVKDILLRRSDLAGIEAEDENWLVKGRSRVEFFYLNAIYSFINRFVRS